MSHRIEQEQEKPLHETMDPLATKVRKKPNRLVRLVQSFTELLLQTKGICFLAWILG